MENVKNFNDFLSETSNASVSGTKAGWTTSLDHKKYELKQDIKGARIGGYSNVILPKGTLIINLPGGVFANHPDLKKNYCTGYGAERWDSQFGVMVNQMPETLESIEKTGKVLESEESVNESTDLDISKLSDGMLKEIRDVFNKAKQGLSNNDLQLLAKLTMEIKKRGIKESVTESTINEGIMSLTAYYKDYDRDVTTPAKKIDDILNKEIKSVSSKNAVLDLITDLVDEYAVAYSDNQKSEW